MLSSSTTRRRARAEATRRHLLEVAATTFAERGYAATSMSELVLRSGVTRGAFYFHFKSKEDLALSAFRLKQRDLIEQQMQRLGALPAGGRAADFLLAALRIRAELLERDPSFACMRRLCTELRADPRLAPQVAAFHAEPVALLAAVIQQAQAEGDIRVDLPAERLARLIFAAIVGIDELGQAYAMDELTTDLLDVVSRGIAASSDG